MAVDYKKEGRIAIFTLNRPDVLNTINILALKELHEALVDFRDDNELWVGIITGTGEKAFCAGADIKDTLPFIKENLQESPLGNAGYPYAGAGIMEAAHCRYQRRGTGRRTGNRSGM